MSLKVKSNGIFYKVVIALLFPMLIIALIIALTGFKGPIQLDNTYYNFMQRAAIESASWGIEIPTIPPIPYGDNTDTGFDILAVLVGFVNFFVNFINIIITVLNMVISLFTTIAAIIKLLVSFKDYDFNTNGDLSWWVDNGRLLLNI